MNTVEENIAARLALIEKISFTMVNELLFTLLYFLRELNRPITASTLARDLGGDRYLINDHLQVLVTHGLLGTEAGKFQISEIGRQAVKIIEEGVGRTPYVFVPVAMASYSSQIDTGSAEASSEGDSLQLSFNILLEDIFSNTKVAIIDRVTTADRSASADDAAGFIDTSRPCESAETAPANIDFPSRSMVSAKHGIRLLDNM